MTMDGYTLRTHIRADLMKLYKAAAHARAQSNEAYAQAKENPKGGDHFSRENVDWLMSFERPERDAYAALGRFFYERLEELDAELDEIDRQIEARDRGEEPYDDEY